MSGLDEREQLFDYLNDPETRHLYVASQIRQLIPLQLRSMREDRAWSQTELGDRAGMDQVRISKLEDPENPGVTLNTLLRLGKAFDVALVVRYAPFSELVDWTSRMDPERLAPPSFDTEQLITTCYNAFPDTRSPKTEITIDTNAVVGSYPDTNATAVPPGPKRTTEIRNYAIN